MKGITLINGVERHRLHPTTFEIPDEPHKAIVAEGDFVKLIFQDDAGQTERMWVKVTSLGLECVGTLTNHPVKLTAVKFGDVVRFQPEHIIDIIYQECQDQHRT
jgi:uncharacterized protein YegJ (DUF2314 family)